jgi:hypothetical protein
MNFSHATSNARKAIVFGGGCEQKENRFVTIMESQIKGFKKNGWDVQPLFTAESVAEDRKALDIAGGEKVKNADKQTLINELDKIIFSQRFKKGGSLFISFNTHRAATKKNFK